MFIWGSCCGGLSDSQRWVRMITDTVFRENTASMICFVLYRFDDMADKFVVEGSVGCLDNGFTVRVNRLICILSERRYY